MRAVEIVNQLPQAPELILFTGDLTHDSEDPADHAGRMRRFQEIAGRLRVRLQKAVPGEHDAGLDGGALYRQFLGDTSYSFDHRGVHFAAPSTPSLRAEEVELTMQEHSGTEAFQQLLRPSSVAD